MKDDTSTPITDSGESPNEFERDKPGTSARALSEGIEDLRLAGGVFVDAVRATRMPMVLTDPTLPGNPIVFANSAFLKLSGYSMEEVLGQQPHFLNGPGTNPQDAPRFREMVRADQDEILETIQYRKNGQRFVATVLLSAFKDDAGRTLHHFMSWLDVTRRVDAEGEVADLKVAQAALSESDTRHRLLIESWAEAIWETDPEGVVVTDSPSWRAYTGQTFKEWRGNGWLDAIHPEDRAFAEQQWREAIAGQGLVNAEFRMRAPDGTWRWTNVRAAPVRDDRGVIVKWAGLNIDIDTRKRAEEALRDSERHQKMLLAEPQHRVRNTLAVVRSIARRTAERSDKAEDMIAHLDGRLNAFSRVQSAVARNPDAGVDLMTMIEDELLAVSTREGERLKIAGPGITLKSRAAESMSLAIHELATNAVKYGALSAQDGRIRVSWKRVEEDGARCLELQWVESGLDHAPTSTHEGFGHELLKRSLPYELKARTRIEFTNEGLRFTLHMPLGGDTIVETERHD